VNVLRAQNNTVDRVVMMVISSDGIAAWASDHIIWESNKYCRSKDDRTFSRTVNASPTKIQAFTSDFMKRLAENKVTKRCLKHQIVPPKYTVFSCLDLKVHQRMLRFDIITVLIES
jgi:hypothetical protein